MAEATLRSGARESNAVKITKYDFRKPNKFGKDQMRTLHVIHEHYARLLGTYLSGILRTYCHAEITSVEEKVYHEYHSSLPDPVILAVTDLPPLKSSVLLEISPVVAFGMLGYLLGGGGGTISENREFTEIETALLERILPPMVRLFKDSWSGILPVEPHLNRIETNSRFIQVMSPNETIACIALDVDIGDARGNINICIPHISIQPFEDKLSSKLWFSSSAQAAGESDQADNILMQLQDSSVELRAVLGETVITAGEVLELQIGDVIQLGSKIRDPIRVYIGDTAKFFGAPGQKNNKAAVRITGLVKGETDNE